MPVVVSCAEKLWRMERRDLDVINVWGMTDIGLVRNENQDAYLVRANEETGHLICVVCDGMGGHTGGRIASKLAAEVFVETCSSNLTCGMSEDEVSAVAEFAVSAANGAVYKLSREEEELRGMGTTLVSAIVWIPTSVRPGGRKNGWN